jgi:uridine kinase
MKVTVAFPSGERSSYPAGTLVEKILKDPKLPAGSSPVVAAFVDKALTSLSYRIDVDCSIEPVLLATHEGASVYRRSLCFLLTSAARQLFPDRRLIIGHSLGRGYFYHFDGLSEVSERDLEALKRRMSRLVAEAHPVVRRVISYREAISYFEDNNQPDTVLLLRNRNDLKVPVFTCQSFMDLAHGPLVPNTSLLGVSDIMRYPPGFLLRYPPWDAPEALDRFQENPVLFAIYREYKDWGKILSLRCVGDLNERINSRNVQQFIQVNEALQDKKIALIADRVTERRDTVRLVLVAGPSSSGKTTFAKKLAIQLQVLGRNPFPISQDDYFLSRDKTPRDRHGNYDFESLRAIDIELLNEHLLRLLEGEEVVLPHYDFQTGQSRLTGQPRKLPNRAVMIVEGIHALNDRLTPALPLAQKYKIYVSALTQLNLDDHNRISTTDNRLLRRIVRDAQFRGHSAQHTLSNWPSVRQGENRNIFPFQNTADSAFNSALDYELAVLKVYAEPLLHTVKPDQAGFTDANRLLSFLRDFAPIPPGWVPEFSILREFIGESAFKY